MRSPVEDHGGMSRARSRLASLSFALCLGLAAGVVTGGDDDDASSTLHVDLQAIIEDAVSKGVTPGVSLAVASDEGPTWLGAAGVGDVERNRAPEGGRPAPHQSPGDVNEIPGSPS